MMNADSYLSEASAGSGGCFLYARREVAMIILSLIGFLLIREALNGMEEFI